MKQNFNKSAKTINTVSVRNSRVIPGNKEERAAAKCPGTGVRSRRSLMLSTAIAALFCAAAGVRPANAQASYSVGTASDLTRAITDANTNNDYLPDLTLSGNVTTPSGTVVPTGTAVGSGSGNGLNLNTGASTLTLSGAGTVWNAGTFGGAFDVNGAGSGGLTVSNGAQLVIPDTVEVGFLSLNSGALTVTGSGSSLTTDYLAVGRGGDASIALTDGARLTTSTASIGEGPGFTVASNIAVLVDGAGTVWNAGNFSAGGATNSVGVTVSNGATIQAVNAGIGVNGAASMLVTGAGSSFADSGVLYIGQTTFGGTPGQGTLTISNGGLVAASEGVLVGADSGTNGTLTVDTNGVLETAALLPGVGDATATFDNGTLRATADSMPDSALIYGFAPDNFIIGAGGMILDSNGFNVTASTVMSGVGGLTKQGAGTLTLTDDNTYTGGTTIAAGTLQLGNGGTSGSILGNIADNGTLAFDRSDSVAFGGTVSGTGAVDQIGTGTTILTANNTYTGGTTISAGTLQLGNGGTSGSILGNVADNGTLAFDRSDSFTFGGTVSGTGAVDQIGTGTTILTANNTYTGGTTISAGTLQFGNGGTSGSILGNVADNGTLAFDRSDSFTFGGTISGTGNVTQTGPGVTVLNAVNTYSGGTTISDGTLAVGDAAHANAALGAGATTVADGATLGGYGTVAGAVTNAGTIAVANALPSFAADANGSFMIGGNLVNQGVVNVAAASGQIGNVLTVGGNYSGANGQLVLNTLLNQGGAATKTDQLVVTGNTSGSTTIQVHATGTGVQTVGDGIELVQVDGTSAANSFRMGNVIQSGAYQYLLYQGGTASANDWYLRSMFESSSGASGAVTPSGNVAYRPGAAGYSLTPLLDADYGFTIMGTLNERVGDIASVEAGQANKTGADNNDGVWGRVSGENFDVDSNNGFSASEQTFFGQFGKDWTLARGANGGSTHAGAMVTFGSMSATFDDSLRSLDSQLSDATGSVETQAQSIGGYWTKYLPDGTYFDGVGQLTHYYNKYGDIYGDEATQNGFSAGASGEVGKPFLLPGSTGIAIEPQVQLLYQYLHMNAADDGVSPISSTSTNGLRGRVGFRLFRANLQNDGRTGAATPYLTFDVLHDFLSPGQTSVGGTPFEADPARTWYDVGAGVTTSMGKSSELYVNIKYARNIGGEYARTVFGQAGYRYSW
ncbi:autotransporter outer membrane beta-barrel domain-containing protein [Paraburkholderia sp. B3]|uniref:autotransporter outer membrane beta-barrel domain-containing protein n=1 Tax=Paraburkholderia sp. B3 TaxID=3134791 RepID=UPI003981BD69